MYMYMHLKHFDNYNNYYKCIGTNAGALLKRNDW